MSGSSNSRYQIVVGVCLIRGGSAWSGGVPPWPGGSPCPGGWGDLPGLGGLPGPSGVCLVPGGFLPGRGRGGGFSLSGGGFSLPGEPPYEQNHRHV